MHGPTDGAHGLAGDVRGPPEDAATGAEGADHAAKQAIALAGSAVSCAGNVPNQASPLPLASRCWGLYWVSREEANPTFPHFHRLSADDRCVDSGGVPSKGSRRAVGRVALAQSA